MSKQFEEVFNSFETIEFSEKWKNNNVYLNYAVSGQYAPKLSIGEVHSFTDNKSRKGFIIGTPKGNIVIFQRYSFGQKDVWIMNSSYSSAIFLGPDYESTFSEESALKLVGLFPDCFSVVEHLNIGKRMNSFLVS